MKTTVFIVGAGSVGASLGRALTNAGVGIIGVHCRTAASADRAAEAVGARAFSGELPEAIRGASVVLVAVPDSAITPLAESAATVAVTAPGQVWLHCAGGLPAEALDPLRGRVLGVGTLHPALAFPRGRLTHVPPGAGFAVEGDPQAVVAAEELVAALGGIAIKVPAERRAAYHAALVLASNYLVALLAEARGVLRSAGLGDARTEQLLAVLGASAVGAAEEVGIDASLTGPISRGDAETVARHLRALSTDPEAARIYRELGRAALRTARARGELDSGISAALAQLLQPPKDE